MARHDIRDWLANQSEDVVREVRAKGGRNNAIRNRAYKSFRECMQAILSLDVSDDEIRAKLVELGLDPSYSNAISMAAINKAATTGDIEAARFARDTVGEKPTEQYNLGINSKDVRSLDLNKLSDAELEALADQADDDPGCDLVAGDEE